MDRTFSTAPTDRARNDQHQGSVSAELTGVLVRSRPVVKWAPSLLKLFRLLPPGCWLLAMVKPVRDVLKARP